ncbi:MAG: trehalase family glycosidase [Chloroflexota bacterium]|nr:trehalase family glycosidase [Chloroflexota bacterium]
MSLTRLLQATITRFRADNPLAPSNVWVFGFVTPEESASVRFGKGGVSLEPNVKEAEYLVYGTQDEIAALLDPEAPSRKAAFNRVRMRPEYPFNDYLMSIFFNTFDLSCTDLDYTAKRFDGPYPFPPRYPANENAYRTMTYTPEPLPTYDKGRLPELVADNHPEWVAMYDFAWERAFKNLRQPEPGSGFVSNFIDPAFNANIFMWDTVFMTMFGRYGRRVFPFIKSLDNFYAKQHDDGFICREINSYSGASVFQPLDPRSTGPNLFAWAELEDFRYSHDDDRLRRVFPAIVAYHRWMRDWRTHPDGSYWTCGWGSGMDNQTRVPNSEWHHRGYTWVDATAQAALSCRSLLGISVYCDCVTDYKEELTSEYRRLRDYVETHLWDNQTGFYYDRAPHAGLSQIKSIAAYWLLFVLSGTSQSELRLSSMTTHLNNSTTFNRPHRVPTQAADSDTYNSNGGYWLGSVWSPTNYMLLRGLTWTYYEMESVAHQIARNHVENVAQVFRDTGTLWENYAPEMAAPGKPAGRDFVGWTGLSAISIPIEFVIGLRTTTRAFCQLMWDIRLTERHGVLRYPLGATNTVDFICEARQRADETPELYIRADEPFTLWAWWGGQQRVLMIAAGETRIRLE